MNRLFSIGVLVAHSLGNVRISMPVEHRSCLNSLQQGGLVSCGVSLYEMEIEFQRQRI